MSGSGGHEEQPALRATANVCMTPVSHRHPGEIAYPMATATTVFASGDTNDPGSARLLAGVLLDLERTTFFFNRRSSFDHDLSELAAKGLALLNDTWISPGRPNECGILTKLARQTLQMIIVHFRCGDLERAEILSDAGITFCRWAGALDSLPLEIVVKIQLYRGKIAAAQGRWQEALALFENCHRGVSSGGLLLVKGLEPLRPEAAPASLRLLAEDSYVVDSVAALLLVDRYEEALEFTHRVRAMASCAPAREIKLLELEARCLCGLGDIERGTRAIQTWRRALPETMAGAALVLDANLFRQAGQMEAASSALQELEIWLAAMECGARCPRWLLLRGHYLLALEWMYLHQASRASEAVRSCLDFAATSFVGSNPIPREASAFERGLLLAVATALEIGPAAKPRIWLESLRFVLGRISRMENRVLAVCVLRWAAERNARFKGLTSPLSQWSRVELDPNSAYGVGGDKVWHFWQQCARAAGWEHQERQPGRLALQEELDVIYEKLTGIAAVE